MLVRAARHVLWTPLAHARGRARTLVLPPGRPVCDLVAVPRSLTRSPAPPIATSDSKGAPRSGQYNAHTYLWVELAVAPGARPIILSTLLPYHFMTTPVAPPICRVRFIVPCWYVSLPLEIVFTLQAGASGEQHAPVAVLTPPWLMMMPDCTPE